ncbi:hypothetical protein QTP86_013002 [Hemibagrus guttatus]|nr:hypothetical protein QTP86_013002 [Hemibagrus guttatus]
MQKKDQYAELLRLSVEYARQMDPSTSASGGPSLQNTLPITDPAELCEIIVRQGAVIRSYQDQVEALHGQLRSASTAAP